MENNKINNILIFFCNLQFFRPENGCASFEMHSVLYFIIRLKRKTEQA